MNTIWNGIEKIYNFRFNGPAKIGTHNQQNTIDLLLGNSTTTIEEIRNWPVEYDGSGEPTKIAGGAPGEGSRVWTGTWGGKRRRTGHERRRQEEIWPEEGAVTAVYRGKPKHPMAKIQLLTCDPSDLWINHVNGKMVTFRRDLRIRGLRSIIRATVQKVKFFINSAAYFYYIFLALHSTRDGSAP
jgi:hypothetical protein